MDDLSFLTAGLAGPPEAADPDPLAFMNPDPDLGDSVFQMKPVPVKSWAEPVWLNLGGSIAPAADPECELPAPVRVPDRLVPTSAAEFKKAIREWEKKEVYAKAACNGAAMGLIYSRTTGERTASLEYQRLAKVDLEIAKKELSEIRLSFKNFSMRSAGAGGASEFVDSDEVRRIHYQKIYGQGD